MLDSFSYRRLFSRVSICHLEAKTIVQPCCCSQNCYKLDKLPARLVIQQSGCIWELAGGLSSLCTHLYRQAAASSSVKTASASVIHASVNANCIQPSDNTTQTAFSSHCQRTAAAKTQLCVLLGCCCALSALSGDLLCTVLLSCTSVCNAICHDCFTHVGVLPACVSWLTSCDSTALMLLAFSVLQAVKKYDSFLYSSSVTCCHAQQHMESLLVLQAWPAI